MAMEPGQKLSRQANPNLNLKNTDKSINDVVKPVFIEFALAIAVNYMAVNFFVVPFTVILLTAAAFIIPLAIFVIRKEYAIFKNDINLLNDNQPELRSMELTSRMALANTVGLAGPDILVHEAGHAFAAKLLFKNANPIIEIRPFQGGSTRFIMKGMSKIGSLLGERCSLLILAAAGIAATSIWATIEMLASQRFAEQRPILSDYLHLHAITNLFHEVMYGLTAFITSRDQLSHDFVYIWHVGGIHPLVAITAMIALPFLCEGYRLISSAQQKAA